MSTHALVDVRVRVSLRDLRHVVSLITHLVVYIEMCHECVRTNVCTCLESARCAARRSTRISILSVRLYTCRISINLIATAGYARQMSNALAARAKTADSIMPYA